MSKSNVGKHIKKIFLFKYERFAHIFKIMDGMSTSKFLNLMCAMFNVKKKLSFYMVGAIYFAAYRDLYNVRSIHNFDVF